MNVLKWQVQIQPKADNQLTKLSRKAQARVLLSIEELATSDNPTSVSSVKHLKASKPKQWR
jgi:mRNA-degrading endonuclease RelE of RelBE toxin-antitoxin system